MTTEQAKQFDIVAYLALNNILPIKITGHQYWYYSPFRDERTPSFKVNRLFNLWYDFGENKGGNLIDLGIRLENCTVKDFLVLLDNDIVSVPTPFSFRQQNYISNADSIQQELQIKILSVHLIRSYHLIQYLQQRRINRKIADKYLHEVRYQNRNKIYYALGFKNNLGGYELRSPYFKGSSSPKGVTFIDNHASDLAVFEGCFDFLSYLCFRQQNILDNEHQNESYLIFNSLSFLEKQLPFMQPLESVHLYLDNDKAGDRATELALSWDNKKFTDKRNLYKGHKDFNEWWSHIPTDKPAPG